MWKEQGRNKTGAARKDRRINKKEKQHFYSSYPIGADTPSWTPSRPESFTSSLHLQIVSFVNTLYSRRVTPVWQYESYVITPPHLPLPAVAPLASFAIQKAFSSGKICVHKTKQRQFQSGEESGKQTGGLIQHVIDHGER